MSPFSLSLAFACLVAVAHAAFTADFRNYIHQTYGVGLVEMLERRDLGEDGSFGGRENGAEVLNNQAVIFVHGITNKISRFRVDEARRFYGSLLD
jgi:hypothetical protein